MLGKKSIDCHGFSQMSEVLRTRLGKSNALHLTSLFRYNGDQSDGRAVPTNLPDILPVPINLLFPSGGVFQIMQRGWGANQNFRIEDCRVRLAYTNDVKG